MAERFIASAPAGQHAETVRQFQRLQTVLDQPGQGGGLVTAVMYGTAQVGTVGTGFSKLTDYDFGVTNAPGFVIDQTTGEITVPDTRVARLTTHVLAEQGTNTQNEQLQLVLNQNGSRRTVAVFDISTNKTAVRQLSASFLFAPIAGQTWLELTATAALGDFGRVAVSFEIADLQDVLA